MNLQLLTRPQPTPRFRDEENGIHAQWGIKGFFYRKTRLPQWSVKGEARVRYSSLVITGQFPRCEKRIPLVDVGYVEDENDILDVRGCNFRLLLFGVENIAQIRDWLRFLIIRQRIPYSLIGKPFEWQLGLNCPRDPDPAYAYNDTFARYYVNPLIGGLFQETPVACMKVWLPYVSFYKNVIVKCSNIVPNVTCHGYTAWDPVEKAILIVYHGTSSTTEGDEESFEVWA
ncbi:unnamed protein product [Nippostrongylus brasiliensis]|uniref:Abhydrolase_3 domain-containing protein n=1 Tax=Nippostrongylus brasiliensis TaxID=27835 RepID=A0A158R277_NIPBR|nr:unnamed protein product [Nippostrongylus brasiliensis]